NYEIYNYLNLINRRLAKAYKYTGERILPNSFVFSKEKIMERLYLNQMRKGVVYPAYCYENRKEMKKMLKNSIKNINKITKKQLYFDWHFSKDFEIKLDFYFVLRKAICTRLLHEFNNIDFNECSAYAEIYGVNPVLTELMEDLGKSDVDFEELFKGLEKKYIIAYHEKFKKINEKNNNLMKKAREHVITNVLVKELSKKNTATAEKTTTVQKEEATKKVQEEKQEQKQVEATKTTVKRSTKKVERTK
ncbi:MAG: hypothetical protein K2K31_02470, partial [Clostridia bacterium]|nr:hypothetical protein [Clostridia bacterium]